MPITLKANAIKYKKQDGTYQGFNAIAKESTEQQLADIQAAGQAKIAAIQSKGQSTIASIPNDYTALNNKVDQLSKNIANTNNVLLNEVVETTVHYDFSRLTKDKSLSSSSGSALIDVPGRCITRILNGPLYPMDAIYIDSDNYCLRLFGYTSDTISSTTYIGCTSFINGGKKNVIYRDPDWPYCAAVIARNPTSNNTSFTDEELMDIANKLCFVTFTTLSNAINNLEIKINQNQTTINNISKTIRNTNEWTSLDYNIIERHPINATTGAEGQENVNYNCTGYIDIRGYDYIRYQRIATTISSTDYGIAFYDENKICISGIYFNMNESSKRYETSFIYIPNGAKYLRCTIWADIETYGDFNIQGHNILKQQAKANLNSLKNINSLLYNTITDPYLILGGWTSGGLDYVTGSSTTNTAYIRTGYISVLAGSTIEVLDGYKFGVVLYTDNNVYIGGKSALDQCKYVVPINCKIRICISTNDGEAQEDYSIAENLIIHLYTQENKLNSYATINDLNYATKYYADSSTFKIAYGGLFNTGVNNTYTNRLRIVSNSETVAIRVGKGSIISALDGFKFNIAMYSEYISNSNFKLLNFVTLRTEPYIIQNDCYIKIGVGTIDNAELWSEDSDGAVILTEAGETAANGIQLELIASTVKNEIANLQAEREDADYWDKMIPLDSEIPLNAIEYHAQLDDLVSQDKLTRTLLGYAKNENGEIDENLPIYLYVLRNDMKHVNPNYSIINWNGSNELYSRPKIFLDSGVHGNERATPYVLLNFIEKLCNNIQYQNLRNAFDWYFIPLVNPWGFSHTAKLISTGVINQGNGYTDTAKNNYQILDNTPTVHQGIRRNAAGIDINRDFGNYATEEAQIFRDTLNTLSQSVGKFIFSIDSHQASYGENVNVIGCFLSLAPGATDEMKQFIWSKWMQAGATTEQVIAESYDREVRQGVYPWAGTSTATTIRAFMTYYTDYSMCFEGGQTMVYYGQNNGWSNKIVRRFINTQYHGFLRLLTKHWM